MTNYVLARDKKQPVAQFFAVGDDQAAKTARYILRNLGITKKDQKQFKLRPIIVKK